MLFPDTATFQEYLPVSNQFSVQKGVSAYFAQVVRRYVIPYLSKDEWDEFLTEYQASISPSPTPFPEAKLPLLKALRQIIANFATLKYLPILTVRMSDSGVSKIASDREKEAYKYEITALKQALIESGSEGIEAMLEELTAKPDTYNEWAGSVERSAFLSCIVTQLADVQKYVDIRHSYILLEKMRPHLLRADVLKIRHILQSSVYEALISAKLGNTLSDIQKELIEKAQPVSVHLAYADALRSNTFYLDQNGIVQAKLDEEQGYTGAEKYNMGAMQIQLDLHTNLARQYESELSAFLRANATDLGYTIPTPVQLNQDTDKTLWLM